MKRIKNSDDYSICEYEMVLDCESGGSFSRKKCSHSAENGRVQFRLEISGEWGA